MTEEGRLYETWKYRKDKSDVPRYQPDSWRGLYALNYQFLLDIYGFDRLNSLLSLEQMRMIENRLPEGKERDDILVSINKDWLWQFLTQKQRNKIIDVTTSELAREQNIVNRLASVKDKGIQFRIPVNTKYLRFRPDPDKESTVRSGWHRTSRMNELFLVAHFYPTFMGWREGEVYGTKVDWAGSYVNLLNRNTFYSIAYTVLNNMLQSENIVNYFSEEAESITWSIISLAQVVMGKATNKSGIQQIKDQFAQISLRRRKELYSMSKRVV